MKANVDRAETRRVLADIADAVRPVERARTAAAVDRVLASASPGCSEPFWAFESCTEPIATDLGIEVTWTGDECPHCSEHHDCMTVDLPDLRVTHEMPSTLLRAWQLVYQPWKVSPHLFGDQS